MQTINKLKGYSAEIVEGISPKTNKPYMIFRIVTEDGKTIYSEFVSDFYKQEYFKRELLKGGNL